MTPAYTTLYVLYEELTNSFASSIKRSTLDMAPCLFSVI